MNRERLPSGLPGKLGVVISLGAMSFLLALVHRALRRAGSRPDFLLLGFARGLDGLERVYLFAVAVACLWAIWKCKRSALGWIQGYALGFGLMLTHYNLGTEVGEKFDPRFVLAFLAGVTSLYSCYLCLAAHIAIAVRERVGRLASRSSRRS
jgi:hypothetical protein